MKRALISMMAIAVVTVLMGCTPPITDETTTTTTTSTSSTTSTTTIPGALPYLVLDGHNNVLGTQVSLDQVTNVAPGDIAFFNPELQRIVHIHSDGSLDLNSQVYFTTPDCTGTPYMDYGPPPHHDNLLAKATVHNYYVVDDTSVFGNVNINSGLLSSGNGCGPTPNTIFMVSVREVTLPFSDPVQLPIQIVPHA